LKAIPKERCLPTLALGLAHISRPPGSPPPGYDEQEKAHDIAFELHQVAKAALASFEPAK